MDHKKIHYRTTVRKIMACNKTVIVFTSFILLSPLAANALNFTTSLFYEGRYSDNIDRIPSEARKDFISSVGAEVGFSSESVRHEYQGGYTFTYLDYLYDSSDDELQMSGNLFASFEMIEDILSWQVDHTQEYLTADRREADNPDNRERRSTFSTGPVLNLLINPTGVDVLTVNTRYAATSFENTDDADSERHTAVMTWQHLASPLTSFSLSAEYSDVTFNNDDDNYEYFRYSVGIGRILKQGDFSFDIGLNTAKPKGDGQVNDEEETGSFFNASLKNQWGRHLLNVSSGRKLTDNSFDFNPAGADSDTTQSATETNAQKTDRDFTVQDIIDRRDISITYGYSFDIDSLSLTLSWYDEDYQVESADQASVILAGTYNMSVGKRSVLTFLASTEITDFKEEDITDKETTYDLGASYAYTYPLTSTLDLTLAVSYDRRLSYGSPSPRYYEETGASLSLRYTPL